MRTFTITESIEYLHHIGIFFTFRTRCNVNHSDNVDFF